jgi:hypothetical protein
VDGQSLVTGVIESHLTMGKRIFFPRFPNLADLRREENSKKTEIENIVIPPGGTLRFTQVGENALAYNLVTFVRGFILSPLGVPENKITDLLSTKLFTKFLEKHLESFVRPESFKDIFSFGQSLVNFSWLDVNALNELLIATDAVLAEELLTKFLIYKTQHELLNLVSGWLKGGEMFNMYLNTITQWGNFVQAQTKEGQPITFSTK